MNWNRAALLATAVSLVVTGPALAASPSPGASLQAAWDRLVLEPSLVHSSVSALAVDLSTGQTLAAINPTTRETPASVTKLFTSAAGLALLGPGFRYTTTVVQSSGALYLVGGGDPWLGADGTAGLAQLAAKVAHRVPHASRVIGVATEWARPFWGVGWSLGDFSPSWGAAASPLMTDRSEVWVTVGPGAETGAPPSVVAWLNQAASLGGTPPVFHVRDLATTGPAGSPDTLTITAEPGTSLIVATGSIPVGTASWSTSVSIMDPALFTAQLFQQALTRDGVSFTAPAATGTAPQHAQTVAVHSSVPLSVLLKTQNQFSINQMAENLFRQLAVGRSPIPTQAASSAIIQQFLGSIGVSTNRVQVDGSGVSALDETSAQQVVDVLSYAARQPWFTIYRNSLMHLNDPANCGFWCTPYVLPAGAQLWIKTGNLSNQWNDAGYAETASGQLIAFAILDDGTPTRENSYPGSSEDQMMRDVAFVPDVPPVAGQAYTPSGPPAALQRLLRLAGVGPVSGDVVGAEAVNVTSGRVAWQENSETLVRAGLTPRLFLAEAALRGADPGRLPPLQVLAAGRRSGTRLSGALVVVGSGDPAVTATTLEALARGVRSAGIRTVAGGIRYVDGVSGWNPVRWPSDMPWEEMGQAWAPPTGAFRVADGQVTVTVTGGDHVGSPATLTRPAGLPVHPVNDVTTSAHPTGVEILPALGSGLLTLTGSVAPSDTVSVTLAPANPGAVAASLFRQDLASAGVMVREGVGAVSPAPSAPVVAEVPGSSIWTLASDSLNGPSAGASETLEARLSRQGRAALAGEALTAGDQIQEWTGLAPENYVTASSLAGLLRSSWNRGQKSLGHLIGQRLWVSTVPEETAVAGYMKGPDSQVLAVAVVIGEELPAGSLFQSPTARWVRTGGSSASHV